MTWEKIAHLVEENYGGYVDWEEKFFECPECGEPVYKCDWRDEDYLLGRTYHGVFYCPVCESTIE